MRLALIVDAFAPARTSAAVQTGDLARELAAQGHQPTVITPLPGLSRPWEIEESDGVQILRVRAFKTKDVGYVRRALAEWLLPFVLLTGLVRSPLRRMRWDGIVWYSPTIFLGPMIHALKRFSRCRSYLVLRDIFPEWAADAGIMKRGLVYRVFKLVERYQYSLADVIGVQTPANLPYLAEWKRGKALEVLNNWLAAATSAAECPIEIPDGKVVFVYAGNMGVAQGMDAIIEVACQLRDHPRAFFLFVGRGSEVRRLQSKVQALGLKNVAFHDEIEPWEIPALLSKCHVGVLSLDLRHTTHNIPGKFLTYLRAGLPVLARVNPGNDLEMLIRTADVGRVSTAEAAGALTGLASELLEDESARTAMGIRARELAARLFSVESAAEQVIRGLQSVESPLS